MCNSTLKLSVAFCIVLTIGSCSAYYITGKNHAILSPLLSSRTSGASESAVDGEYPYQVSIRVHGAHKCSGSLLNSRWILSSAHCLSKYELGSLIIVLGTTSLISGGVAFPGCELQLHPGYTPGSSDRRHDLALLKLTFPVEYSWCIKPIALPSQDSQPEMLNFTGWVTPTAALSHFGADKSDDPFSLKVLNLPTLSLEECRRVFPIVGTTNVCTLSDVPGQGLCYGDAGGALVANGVQIAVASWGAPCARGYPDVHVRVYDHVDWIRSIIRSDDVVGEF